MKILIPGGAGYIGSTLCTELLRRGHFVRVLDPLWFNERVPLMHYSNPNYEFLRVPISQGLNFESIMRDIDFLIIPAAVVGDPACNKYSEIAKELNLESTKYLIDKSIKYHLKGLFFFSTCSNYGVSNDQLATESTELNPLSLYSETKVIIENYIQEKCADIDWIIGRLSTVYGLSFRMRFDLTVNEFALKGFNDKYIDIFKPESYRPYIHVYDLASVIGNLLDNFQLAKNNIFNIGFPGENYKKIHIAELVKRHIPDTKIEILKSGGDNRDYKVDFSKLQHFIKIDKKFDVEMSITHIIETFKAGLYTDLKSKEFYNTSPTFYNE